VVKINRFGHIGHLVTKAAFNSGQVDIVAVSAPFVVLNCMVYMFQYDSTRTSSKAQSRLRMGSLSSLENPSLSSGL
jgi:glyceraldehyde 3-phosphate dehydrogenase